VLLLLGAVWVCEIVKLGGLRLEEPWVMWIEKPDVPGSALEGRVSLVSGLGNLPLKVFVGARMGEMVVVLVESFLSALVEG
jgi:hypothetical protein